MASTITNLETVDVWKTKSKFDYDLWSENVKIKLVNVNWDDEDNVVVFDDPDKRREYFEGLLGYEIPKENLLNTLNQIMTNQSARVEIPFGQMNFNYLVVYHAEIPVSVKFQQSQTPTDEDRFYFIEDSQQISPSVTELLLTPDIWTTYQFDVNIKRGHITRGHFGIDNVTVTDLFQDELVFDRVDCNINTLPEPITINHRQVGNSKVVPLTGTSAYLCIMTSADIYSDAWTNADGTPTIPYLLPATRNGGIANGTNTFAIQDSQIDKFISNVPKQFWKSCKGAFYADQSWLYFTSAGVSKWGVTIQNIGNTNAFTKHLKDVTFTKDDFGFNSKYAKSYTGQFCPIDIMAGERYIGTIGLENFNSIRVGLSSNVIYPFIKIEAMLEGINRNGNFSYQWERLDVDQTTTIDNSDWRQTLYDLNVPVFAVSELPLNNYDYEAAAPNARTRYNRDIDKQIADRNNSNSKTNADNSANTSFTNSAASLQTSFTNSNRSNDASLANAERSAQTSQTNSNASNDNSLNVANRQNQFEYDQNDVTNTYENDDDAAVGIKRYEMDNQIRTFDMEKQILDDDFNYATASGAVEAAVGMGFQGLRQFGVSPSASFSSNANQMAGGGGGAIQAAATATSGLTAFAGGALIGAGSNITQWALAQARLQHDYDMATIRANTGKAIYQSLATETRVRTREFNQARNTDRKTNADSIAQTNHDVASANITRDYNTTTFNANNSHDVAEQNIADDKTTGDNNNTRSRDLSLGINTNNFNTTAADITDNFNRVDVNINYDREQSMVSGNLERGGASGSYYDYTTGNLAYQFIIRKPDQKSQGNLESLFDNYGYTWDEFVVGIDHSRFINPNRNNNYWQMDDILFEPMQIKQQYIRKIKDMFANGVRMWDVEALNGGGLG